MKTILIVAVMSLWLSACSPSAPLAPATPTPSTPASSPRTFEPQRSVEAGVTIAVTPQPLAPNAPLVFEVVMDTHSVDLSDDLTKVSLLRDDAGTEYKPTAWDGAGPGGHHRSGALKFAPLSRQPKSLTLVIKEVAGVPERIFRWQLAD